MFTFRKSNVFLEKLCASEKFNSKPHLFQEAHPVRLRQIHIINAVPIVDKVLNFIRPLMKSEVAAMVSDLWCSTSVMLLTASV